MHCCTRKPDLRCALVASMLCNCVAALTRNDYNNRSQVPLLPQAIEEEHQLWNSMTRPHRRQGQPPLSRLHDVRRQDRRRRIRTRSSTARSTRASTSSTPPMSTAAGAARRSPARRSSATASASRSCWPPRSTADGRRDPNARGTSRRHIIEQCEASLRRLRPTTSTSTRSTARDPRSRSTRRCARSTTWCARARCATSAPAPSRPGKSSSRCGRRRSTG